VMLVSIAIVLTLSTIEVLFPLYSEGGKLVLLEPQLCLVAGATFADQMFMA